MTEIHDTNEWSLSAKAVAAALLAVWAGLAYLVGITELVAVPATQGFRPIALTAVVPVAVFLAAYGLSARFRGFVLSQDIAALTGLQHWRVVGFAFLLLYAYGVLPGLFAWAAGLGDVLVGLAAPLAVARLARDPAFAHSRRFLAFHALGLLDFAVAVAAATLASGAFPSLVAGPVTSAPMEVWPLNLFPSFLVPIFIILHLVVFLKLRALRRATHGQTGAALQTVQA